MSAYPNYSPSSPMDEDYCPTSPCYSPSFQLVAPVSPNYKAQAMPMSSPDSPKYSPCDSDCAGRQCVPIYGGNTTWNCVPTVNYRVVVPEDDNKLRIFCSHCDDSDCTGRKCAGVAEVDEVYSAKFNWIIDHVLEELPCPKCEEKGRITRMLRLENTNVIRCLLHTPHPPRAATRSVAPHTYEPKDWPKDVKDALYRNLPESFLQSRGLYL